MSKKMPLSVFLFSVLVFTYACSISRQTGREALTSYEEDLRPIMLERCTPCHFPERGRKEMLDTYEATREHIDDILQRIQLPVSHKEFMPFKQKREPLSDSLIQVFVAWKESGMGE